MYKSIGIKSLEGKSCHMWHELQSYVKAAEMTSNCPVGLCPDQTLHHQYYCCSSTAVVLQTPMGSHRDGACTGLVYTTASSARSSVALPARMCILYVECIIELSRFLYSTSPLEWHLVPE